ncbi:MAG: hypothetical protein ACXWR4_21860, partial [Bdellovibrionota bacterium]
NWERNLDAKAIATFSKDLGKLGFKYQFITLAGWHSINYHTFDLAKNFGEEDVIALAINGGCDILLYKTEERGRAAMDVAFKFLASGRISPEQVEASYARIKEVKERVLQPFEACVMENIAKVVGCEAHQEVLQLVLDKRRPGGEIPE